MQMRINFSSKTKGSGKITPFYTIKAGKKSAFGDANGKCWSKKGRFPVRAMRSWDPFLYFAWLIWRRREAASGRRSFRAGINCRLIFGNDQGEPSQRHIVRTCSDHGCDVGPLGSGCFRHHPAHPNALSSGTRRGSATPAAFLLLSEK